MSDNVIQVSDGDFDAEVLASDRPVHVDFWAEWCVPCHMVSPVVEEIARDHAGELKAAKLNVDDNPETTRKYGVMSIPTLIVFKDGKEQARVVGARGKDAILREIQPHLAGAGRGRLLAGRPGPLFALSLLPWGRRSRSSGEPQPLGVRRRTRGRDLRRADGSGRS